MSFEARRLLRGQQKRERMQARLGYVALRAFCRAFFCAILATERSSIALYLRARWAGNLDPSWRRRIGVDGGGEGASNFFEFPCPTGRCVSEGVV